jgi:hypothetical protein
MALAAAAAAAAGGKPGSNSSSGSAALSALLQTLSEGQRVLLLDVTPCQHFTKPPPRFSEASMVKTLEELGVGRPSTYAPIIRKLLVGGCLVRVGALCVLCAVCWDVPEGQKCHVPHSRAHACLPTCPPPNASLHPPPQKTRHTSHGTRHTAHTRNTSYTRHT